MDVVGHPDTGMDRQSILVRSFNQGIPEELVIRFDGKDQLTIIAPLNDVPGCPGRTWRGIWAF